MTYLLRVFVAVVMLAAVIAVAPAASATVYDQYRVTGPCSSRVHITAPADVTITISHAGGGQRCRVRVGMVCELLSGVYAGRIETITSTQPGTSKTAVSGCYAGERIRNIDTYVLWHQGA